MIMQMIWRVIVGLILSGVVVATVKAEDELKAMLDRVMAQDIKPVAGFTAKVIVPPGQMYDPLVMHLHGDTVWLNDDGKEEGDKGSRLLRAQFAGYEITEVDKEHDKDRVTYEVELKKGDDKLKVHFDENGKVVKKKGKIAGEKTKEKEEDKH